MILAASLRSRREPGPKLVCIVPLGVLMERSEMANQGKNSKAAVEHTLAVNFVKPSPADFKAANDARSMVPRQAIAPFSSTVFAIQPRLQATLAMTAKFIA